MPIVIINILALSAFALIESIQLLIYAGTFLGYKPSMNMFFYVVLVLCIGFAQGIGLWFFRHHLWTKKISAMCVGFIVTEAVLVFAQVSALWQMIIYGNRSALAWRAYIAFMVLSVVNKIFWPHIRRCAGHLYSFILLCASKSILRMAVDAACVLLIIAMIYVPDPEAHLAKMFFGEHFGHYDFAIMAPAYACSMGNLLFVDNFSTYGFGMPLIMAQLAKLVGGFNDLNIFIIMVILCIMVYLCYYGFLRYFLKSIPLSLAAVLVGIKLQMFYSFAYPLTFTYANSTAVRFCMDMFFLGALLLHLKTHRRGFLLLAALFAGFAAFFILSTGVDLIVTFYAYISMHLVVKSWRSFVCPTVSQWWHALGLYVLPLVVAFGLYVLIAGPHAYSSIFWKNIGQMHGIFLDGFLNNLMFFHVFSIGEYWNGWMSLVMPTVLIISLIYIGLRSFRQEGRYEDLFIICLCVYGLSMFQHFVALPVGNNYYMRALPFVFVMFYWISRLIARLDTPWRLKMSIAVLGIAAYALLTNHLYISHPNMLNFSRNPMVDPLVAEPLPDGSNRPYFNHQEAWINDTYLVPVNSLGERDQGFLFESQFPNDEMIKELYRKESDFTPDAQLIDSLTSKEDKVALISSYEWRILSQAQRKPFFYAFPLIYSRPMRSRSFSHTSLYHKDFLNREIANLEHFKPEYVFVQRLFLNPNLPQAYYRDFEGLIALIKHIKTHYEPFREGHYLTALKRREQ